MRADPSQHAALTEIAIVGMSGRFPGSRTVEEYWRAVCRAEEGIRSFDAREVEQAGVSAELLLHPNYVKRGGVVEEFDAFDAQFFSVSPREAEAIEPQHRLMLELVWEALEGAGIDPAVENNIGVFAGCSRPGYLSAAVAQADAGWLGSPEHFQSVIATDRDYLATRVSYKLGLVGPSVSVQTACSTSLVAVHFACQSLLLQECDVALAGGVALQVPHRAGYLWQEGGYSSRDGHCRPFDAQASGTVFGSGGAVVVLRRLADALEAGDRIIAVIKGSAIGNDGSQKVGFTAPSVAGQARVIRAAQAAAGISASSVGYVEAHGTGTLLGDPIEVAALTLAFGPECGVGRCALGSVKGNVGHLDTAAGVAGLIKTALSVREGVLPPSLHFERANPAIDFEGGPFYVNTRLRPWPEDAPYAGVSSFGIGGTNAHVIVGPGPRGEVKPEEVATPGATMLEVADAPGAQLLVVSARSGAALEELAARYESWLGGEGCGHAAGEIAAAAARRRAHHPHRLAVVGDTAAALAQSLAVWRGQRRQGGGIADGTAARSAAAGAAERSDAAAPVWVFSGQGGQWLGMGKELLSGPVNGFAETVAQVDAQVRAIAGWSVRSVLEGSEAGRLLSRASVAQVAVFTLQVGLAAAWRELGLRPAAVLGHSMGEVAAAVAAGILTLEEGVRIICARGEVLESQGQKGLMALVELEVDAAESLVASCGGSIWIAAYNSSRSVVLAGDPAALASILLNLKKQGSYCREFDTGGIAGHGPGMATAAGLLEARLTGIGARTGQIPFFSTLTAASERTLDAHYWARNLCQPVRLAQTIAALKAAGHRLYLEIGARPALASAIGEGGPVGVTVFASSDRGDARATFLQSLGRLYERGFNPNWHALHPKHPRNLPLPRYPWQKQRYWSHQQDAGRNGRGSFSERYTSPIERMLSSYTLSSVDNATHYWEGVIDPGVDPTWRDHKVNGILIVPAAALIDMVLSAIERLHLGASGVLSGIEFCEAVVVSEKRPCRVQLALRVMDGVVARFTLASRAGKHESSSLTWSTNVRGNVELSRSGSAPPSRSAPWSDSDVSIGADRFYGALDRSGVHYGPSFRVLRQIDCGTTVGYASIDGASPRFALLDGALQTLFAIGAGAEMRPRVPIRIGELWIAPREELKSSARTWASMRESEAAAGILDAQGRELVRLEGIATQPLLSAGGSSDGIVQLVWQRREVETGHDSFVASRRSLLIVSPGVGFGAAIAGRASARGHDSRHVNLSLDLEDPTDADEWHEVLDRWLGDCSGSAPEIVFFCESENGACARDSLLAGQRFGCLAIAALVKGLSGSALPSMPRFTFVGRHCTSASPCLDSAGLADSITWGFLRTLAIEHREFKPRALDLGDIRRPDEALSNLLKGSGLETELAFRGTECLVPRLLPSPPRVAGRSAFAHAIRPDATYLIAGGTGGLGVAVSRWLWERGAKYLVLVGMHEPNADAAAVITELRKSGCDVVVECCDLGEEDELRAVIASIDARGPPLKGVIQAAGTLRDSLILNITPAQLYQALLPKAVGAWNLHTQTRQHRLDFFVMFSSVVALLGAPGQAVHGAANAFLDALAHHRRSMGLPGLSINWGIWAQTGYAAKAAQLNQLQSGGIELLSTERALEILDSLFSATQAQYGAFRFDARDWLRQYPSFELPPMVTELAADRAPMSEGGQISDDLELLGRETDYSIRRGILERIVARELGAVLRVPVAAIDSQRPFSEANLDSLLSLELRSRLEGVLRRTIPTSAIWRHPTCERLADYLGQGLQAHTSTKEQVLT